MSKWRPESWIRVEDYNTPDMPHQGCGYYDITGKMIDDLDTFEQGADAMLDSIVRKELELELTETKYQELISMIFEELEAFINKEQKDEQLKMKSYLLKKLEEIK